MEKVFVIADSIVSPLGFTTKENFDALCQGLSSVESHDDAAKSDTHFVASLFEDETLRPKITRGISAFTKFEKLLALSIGGALKQTSIDASDSRTALIVSSTKGNISLLEDNEITDELKEQISLSSSAKKITELFGITTKPVIVSHACISGLVAMITAKRMLQAGLYESVIVAGADIITKFILSGFQSFQAVSDELCKPFDKNRTGINLGEAAATVVLSVHKPQNETVIHFAGGSISNDANHISGPSRTGEELFQAIDEALKESGINKNEIGFISAHGTATMYNDDMESKAITLAGLQNVPVNSLKGYYGHTLGAAGLLEVVISIQSLKESKIIPTKGFSTAGTAQPINVCSTLQHSGKKAFLKTASGFGGCNAAVVMEKATCPGI